MNGKEAVCLSNLINSFLLKFSIRELVEVEHRSKKHYYGAHDNDATDNLVDEQDAVVVKFAPHLVNEPRKPEPPHQCSHDDAGIAHAHLQRPVGHDKRPLGK